MPNLRLTFSKQEIGKAIELAAKENYERDLKLVGLRDAGPWDEVKGLYFEEAEYLLRKTGRNWEPELPHHHFIVLS